MESETRDRLRLWRRHEGIGAGVQSHQVSFTVLHPFLSPAARLRVRRFLPFFRISLSSASPSPSRSPASELRQRPCPRRLVTSKVDRPQAPGLRSPPNSQTRFPCKAVCLCAKVSLCSLRAKVEELTSNSSLDRLSSVHIVASTSSTTLRGSRSSSSCLDKVRLSCPASERA